MAHNLETIFSLGDRGVIALPPEIGRLRTALETIDALEFPDQPHPLDLAAQLVEDTVQAVESGDPAAVDYGVVHRAAVAAQEADARSTAVREARGRLASRLSSAVHTNAQTLVQAMQAVFNRTVTEYAEALTVAQQWPDPARALTAPAKVRTALSSRLTLRETIDAITAARAQLWSGGYRCDVDELAEFAMASDGHKLWPRPARQMNPRAPWEGVDKLDFFLTHGASVWLPTTTEQAAAYDRVYGDATREQQNRLRSVRATASMMAGGERLPTYNNAADQASTPSAATDSRADQVRRRLFPDTRNNDNEVTITTDTMGRLVATP